MVSLSLLSFNVDLMFWRFIRVKETLINGVWGGGRITNVLTGCKSFHGPIYNSNSSVVTVLTTVLVKMDISGIDQSAGEIHKLAKERDQHAPIRTEQVSSIKFLLSLQYQLTHLYRQNAGYH